jgi:predicted O-methyltransferase YrrM
VRGRRDRRPRRHDRGDRGEPARVDERDQGRHRLTGGAYSVPAVQRLVATLVASKPGGRIAEIGTSYGDGAEAIASALAGGASFVTVELDAERAAAARARLAGTDAEVLHGDWRDVLPPLAPFDVLFADGGVGYERAVDLLAPGGILVKDDLTPGGAIEGDPVREALLLDPRVAATEILVTTEMACVVAVRRT